MSRPSANLRLFVAIHPPIEIAQALLHSLAKLNLPPHRLTPAQQIHITVQFIGDTPSDAIDDTIESVQRAGSGLPSFQLSCRRLITLPQRGSARLVAAETDVPATLMELHRRLVTRLARTAREKSQEHFRPHFTLCRFRAPARGVTIDEALSIPSLAVQRITLMRSTLTAEGAKHHELMSYQLNDGGRATE